MDAFPSGKPIIACSSRPAMPLLASVHPRSFAVKQWFNGSFPAVMYIAAAEAATALIPALAILQQPLTAYAPGEHHGGNIMGETSSRAAAPTGWAQCL